MAAKKVVNKGQLNFAFDKDSASAKSKKKKKTKKTKKQQEKKQPKKQTKTKVSRKRKPAAPKPATTRRRTAKAATAESMAAKQRDISISEFFAKNRHLLGFDNPRKALLTAVKEAVDNSLDACEEAHILPDLLIDIKHIGNNKFTLNFITFSTRFFVVHSIIFDISTTDFSSSSIPSG